MKYIYSSIAKPEISILPGKLVITNRNLRGFKMKIRSRVFLLLTVCWGLCINVPSTPAQNFESTSHRLEEALDQNRNLISGINGSYNEQGYEIPYEKNGEPAFSELSSVENTKADSKSGVITWSAMGAGLNYNVAAIAVSGKDVYVGGQFTFAGGVSANRIARWNGSNWSALGSGLNGIVNTIAISGSDVYVGGAFTTAGGIPVGKIAKWNGNSWSALGDGLNYTVNSIAVSGSDVYAGGIFTMAGGSPANYIAKWDGNSWSTLGTGMNLYVHAIAVSGSDVYVAGQFTFAGGNPANRIARWDGSNWSALGSGADDVVNVIAASGNDIYIGGRFRTAGGNAAPCIAKWNGNNWSTMLGLTSFVNAIAVSGTDVYAGGSFHTSTGSPGNYIAKWNGNSWSALGGGTYNVVYALAINPAEARMIVGGTFTHVDAAMSTNYIAGFTDSGNTFPFAFSAAKPLPGNGSLASFGNTNLTFTGDVSVSDSVLVYYYQVSPLPGELPSGIIRIGDYYWRISSKGIIFTNGSMRIATQDLYGVTVGGCGACLVWLKRSGSGDPWQNLGGIFNGTFDNGSLTSNIQFDSFSEFAIGATEDLTTAVSETLSQKAFKLYQNYPNPFSQTTKIQYETGNIQMISLKVYDLLGKEIRSLVNEIKPAGMHEVDFDGSRFASGTYILVLKSGTLKETKPMILSK